MSCIFSSMLKFHFSPREMVKDYKQSIWSAFLFLSQKITFVNYQFSWQAQQNAQEYIFKSHQIFTLHAF